MKYAATRGVEAVALALLLALHPIPAGAQPGGAVPAARQAALIHLLKQDCGSCHGLTLAGGLGPPLRPEDLAAKPAAWLRAVILDGVPGTAMPPWRAILTEEEVDWLVTVMREGLRE